MPEQRPIIGYDNHLEEGTTTTDGSDPENAYDWFTHDAWTTANPTSYLENTPGGTKTVDYLAVAAHDIDEQTGSIKLQHWTGAAYADTPGSDYTPPDGSPFMLTFAAVSATKFKVVLSGLDANASVGVVSIGQRLELERGFAAGFVSPSLARTDKIMNARTQSGAFLGRSLIRTGVGGRLRLNHLSESWVRNSLEPFLLHARDKGWFLLWNKDTQTTEVAYCWTTKMPQPPFESPGLISVSIGYEGIAT